MIRHAFGLLMAAGLMLLIFAAVLWSQPVRASECQTMVASHYGAESGNRTANGERFDGSGMTAAHNTLPFGTRLRVSYGGKSVVVRVNDRGPFIKGRHLDLSTESARRLGLTKAGVGKVTACRL